MSRPGEDLIDKGLADLDLGKESIASLLVSIGAPRLKRSGIKISAVLFEDPEHRLYSILRAENPDNAHSQYNALIRKLVSFERALECGT
jgi:hypothetical protein